MPEWVKALLLATCGSGGIMGVLFYFLKKWIENRLKKAEETAKQRQQLKQERMKIDDELHQAYGRMFFWINYAITKKVANGELKEAFEHLQEVENKKKELDRQSICAAVND